MTTTFRDLWNELMADAKGLDSAAAKKYANRAYLDVCREREWGFLKARGTLECPASVSTGTVSVTQFGASIQFDASATTVFDSFGLNPSIADCQIKVSSGLPYQIRGYATGGAATLDRIYEEGTDTSASFKVLRCYFKPPSSDFARLISVADSLKGKPILYGPRWTAKWLDLVDPKRTNEGEPYCLVPVQADGSNGPLYEMWPHPTTQQAFTVLYRRKGVELSNDDELPSTLPANLVLARAKYRAYEFKVSDAAEKGSRSVSAFVALMRASRDEYDSLLKDANRLDREREMDSLATQTQSSFVNDAEWLQSHVWGIN